MNKIVNLSVTTLMPDVHCDNATHLLGYLHHYLKLSLNSYCAQGIELHSHMPDNLGIYFCAPCLLT